MEEVKKIIANIEKGIIAPIYFLMDEEPYFIDVVANYLGKHLLEEDQEGFDQLVLYGQGVTVPAIIDYARRFPMIAERQLIIIKEAQNLRASVDQLVPYVESPTASTVLVFCYKYRKLDARKKLLRSLGKNQDCVVMESRKLYKNQVVSSFLPDVFKKKHLSIQPKATQMLVDFLGNDLSRIENRVNKLALIMPADTEVTPDIIEKNIGISKEFNNFELKGAFATNGKVKIARIIKHFAENPKDNPLVVTLAVLYGFFQKLLIYHSLTDVSDESVMAAARAAFFDVKDLHSAAQHYPMKKVSAIVTGLQEIDVKNKDVGAASTTPADLLKELVMIMN